MQYKLLQSLKKDKVLLRLVKKNLKKYKSKNFDFKVNLQKKNYIRMIKNRYISCLLNISESEIKKGVDEINANYESKIKFTDTLNCINYKK